MAHVILVAIAPEDLRRACSFGLDEILGGD